MSTSARRNLFVIWHWSEHQNEAIPLEGNENAFLHCVSDQITGAELDGLLARTALPDTQNILLLHEKEANPRFREQDATRERWSTDEKSKSPFLHTGRFSKGEDFIYYRREQETGLLMSSGYLTTPPGMYPQVFSVLNHKRDLVLPRYFNSVWDYYAFRAKFRVFDLKENLFIYLTGSQPLGHSCVLPELGTQDFHFLKERYRAFTDLEGEFEKDSLKHSKHLYAALKTYLDATPLDIEGYLHSTGQHFRHLLGAMPGKIH